MDPETESAATTPEEPKDTGAELLAAVNQAIDGETTQPLETTETEGETPPAGEETKPPEGETTAAEGETTERGPDGKFLKAGEKAAEPKGAEKQPDPVNDPIPDEIQGRTRQRMEQLIKHVKESTNEATRIRQERDDLVDMVQQTGATPEQFNDALQYLAAVNSGDPARVAAAIQTLQRELTALSQMTGQPVPGVDTLANHPDLRQAVEAGDLSEAHARELAAARDQRAFAQARTTQATQARQQQDEQAQQIESGRQALNALEAQLKADPDYARKRAILIPTLQPVLAQLHPSQWAQTFQNAYQQLKLGPAPVPPRAAPGGQQPLRARQPAGQTAKAPTSLLEAINAGIDQGSRG
jgi:DNA repair exonuclease SbcCD ATPase subunit